MQPTIVNHYVRLISAKLERWVEAAVKMLPNIIVALIIFFIFYWIGRIFRDSYKSISNRFSDNRSINSIVGTTIFITIVGIGLFSALEILKLDKAVTSLLAGAGVIGLALGFAFQEIASNFLAGSMIAVERPYEIGDIIEINEQLGTVRQIKLRTTHVETYQGLEIIIPNKMMFTSTMINYTSTPRRRIDLEVGIAYNSDLNKVKAVLRDSLENLYGRIDSEPIEVFFNKFDQYSVNLNAQVWVKFPGNKGYFKAYDEAICLIKEAFESNKIEIPFPVQKIEIINRPQA